MRHALAPLAIVVAAMSAAFGVTSAWSQAAAFAAAAAGIVAADDRLQGNRSATVLAPRRHP